MLPDTAQDAGRAWMTNEMTVSGRLAGEAATQLASPQPFNARSEAALLVLRAVPQLQLVGGMAAATQSQTLSYPPVATSCAPRCAQPAVCQQ
jgi:hypothetical protein